MRMNRDCIIQVSQGILLAASVILSQRAVDKEMESQQDNERQHEDHCQSNVYTGRIRSEHCFWISTETG